MGGEALWTGWFECGTTEQRSRFKRRSILRQLDE